MKYLVRMALRNTLRNRRRSLLTLVAIFFGVGIFVLAQSLIAGIERTMIGSEIDSEQAHLRVMSKAFAHDEEFFPVEQGLTDAEAVASAITRASPEAHITRRVSFRAELGDRARRLTCRGLAIEPADYQRVIRLGDLAPRPPNAQHWVWLGADLASAFGVTTGARMTLQAKTRAGARNALTDVVVAGVVSTGHPLVDNFTVLLPMQSAAELLAIEPTYATEILARFPRPDDALPIERELERDRPQVVAETWREKTEYIVRFNDVRRAVFNVFTVVIMLMAAAGVANTTLMSGFERITEIGALLALGLNRRRVMALFLLEATLLAGVGVVAGLVAGGVPTYWFSLHGLPFPGASDEAGASLPIPPVLYLELTSSTLAMAVALGFGVTVVAALYPAWKLSRTDPIHALKVEG